MKEERRVAPNPVVMQERAMWGRYGDPSEAHDTLGKLWCQGLLTKSRRHDADILREAGRFYANAYWHHYSMGGDARIGGYQEMVGGSIPALVIPDEEADWFRSEQFKRLDSALGGASSLPRSAVYTYAVAERGCHLPGWMTSALNGWTMSTMSLRADLERLTLRAHSRDKTVRAIAKADIIAVKRALLDAESARLHRLVPWDVVAALCEGLEAVTDAMPQKIVARLRQKSVGRPHKS